MIERWVRMISNKDGQLVRRQFIKSFVYMIKIQFVRCYFYYNSNNSNNNNYNVYYFYN